jgi:hypothetical protein
MSDAPTDEELRGIRDRGTSRAAAGIAALDLVVLELQSAGIPATRDPGDFQPPGAIVSAPTISGIATMGSIGLEIPIYAVTDQPGADGLDQILEWACEILELFNETGAEPTSWISPLNPSGLPAYLVTLRWNVTTG